jgi:hypothetical protein
MIGKRSIVDIKETLFSPAVRKNRDIRPAADDACCEKRSIAAAGDVNCTVRIFFQYTPDLTFYLIGIEEACIQIASTERWRKAKYSLSFLCIALSCAISDGQR